MGAKVGINFHNTSTFCNYFINSFGRPRSIGGKVTVPQHYRIMQQRCLRIDYTLIGGAPELETDVTQAFYKGPVDHHVDRFSQITPSCCRYEFFECEACIEPYRVSGIAYFACQHGGLGGLISGVATAQSDVKTGGEQAIGQYFDADFATTAEVP